MYSKPSNSVWSIVPNTSLQGGKERRGEGEERGRRGERGGGGEEEKSERKRTGEGNRCFTALVMHH